MVMLMKGICSKLNERLLSGEVTFRKTDFWIVAGIFTMAGMLAGLFCAPLTHGITICCGNNNGNGNTKGSGCEEEDCAGREDENC